MMKIKEAGFTLIELVMFIIISSLLAGTILTALTIVTRKTPTVHQQVIATQIAKQCMEWYVGQRKLNGYSSLTCPNTTPPSFCTTQTGYTVSVNVVCTTISSDANYKTITVTVSG